MRKHKQNQHTGDVARSNMNTADSSVPNIDAKLKNHKTGDMKTADKCQLCKKKFADSTFKYHRPFKCKKCEKKSDKCHLYKHLKEHQANCCLDTKQNYNLRRHEDNALTNLRRHEILDWFRGDTGNSEEKDHMERVIDAINLDNEDHMETKQELNQIKLQQNKTGARLPENMTRWRPNTWHLATYFQIN